MTYHTDAEMLYVDDFIMKRTRVGEVLNFPIQSEDTVRRLVWELWEHAKTKQTTIESGNVSVSYVNGRMYAAVIVTEHGGVDV